MPERIISVRPSARTHAQGKQGVTCNGGGGVLGHPLVYLSFGNKSQAMCYYCGKRFKKKSPSV